MKNTFKALAIFSAVWLGFTFSAIKQDGLSATYGVSEDNPAAIELVLNKDYSFTYQDLSASGEHIKVKGTYSFKNNKVTLNSSDAKQKFHDKWKISSNGQVAKSRKGMTYYSLRKK